MDGKKPPVDDLAVERTLFAAERTLMAWIRTALSMISFGFTIYKFLNIFLLEANNTIIRPHEPRNVGLFLIGLGSFALVIAVIQHFRYIKRINPDKRYKFWTDLSFLTASLLIILGFLMFGSIILNTGPFS
ncbi:YidH family protein [Adhaeribacter soli]|uniref:DUF202 domain-containing protein n=1 Tax=Adhaeribacter soli TaxID=2607655 RepID=A0A5N1IRP0_9BACT|nr:DUF202 domain-containing protein [Adhaeribacter soli]KAA9332835.1 DUF202 domain-containing protein [Adhaeribacter soli]